MNNIIALIPVVLVIVTVFFFFKISAVIVGIFIFLALIGAAIKLIINSSKQVKAIKERTCYKCGAKMVLRTSKTGKYKGKKFYGCSNYPKCNCMIDIDGKSISISILYRKYRKIRKPAAKEKNTPICSKCGAEMVLRTASQGVYKGRKFYGCSSYPECKNIVRIEEKNQDEGKL